MNAQPQPVESAESVEPTLDARHPWLGLASFTEETRAYFFGRDEEVAELARRVQRKLLTVLFGQSGLGKTSILRAGLVPRLRDQGYCPIYVRVDYGREALEPSDQIKEAIKRTARRAGEWTQVGVASAGESLWEYLHHRDDVLRDESGKTLIPLLIFDQFEEIFTLAQSDDFGRARAATFVADLADLVENRPPKAVEAKLEADDEMAERFDFARSDYRVLISLREDYLAPLEGLKNVMPSITQNRLRLAPMTGIQAMTAVMRPGKGLVSEEVAAAIVRFVAGGAELANAEVEPSLLSLICRELNDTRIAQDRAEISLDLLAGSHATILSNFYERALEDQPAAVRRVIEDELLTASGFRENVAEERLVSSFEAAGAKPGTVALLVNRRLLRIEERLDARRVELTHDVLCGVVKYSRDQRQEREARAATERMLAAQRERELAARQSLVRARQVAAVCGVLAIGAVFAAVLAYVNSQRAHRAEQVAEQARTEAEHLLGYLSDDFVRELESFGELNVVAEFAKRQIDYFHGLPPALKGADTMRNAALAMVHYARAKRVLGDPEAASVSAAEAVQLLEQRRSAGDQSDATIIALALAYCTRAQILDNQNDPAGQVAGKRAVELLRPLVETPNASVAARRAYVEALVRVGFEAVSGSRYEDAVRYEGQAMRLAATLGARDLSDLSMGAYYAEAGAWMVNGLSNLDRNDEAKRAGADVMALSDQVLAKRPGYRLALHAQQLVVGWLGAIASSELNPTEALRQQKRAEQISLTSLGFDPENVTTLNNLSVAQQNLGDALVSLGQMREALTYYRKTLDVIDRATRGGAGFFLNRFWDAGYLVYRLGQLGDFSEAGTVIDSGVPFLTKLRKSEPKGSVTLGVVDGLGKIPVATVAYMRGDYSTAQRISMDVAKSMDAIKPADDSQQSQKSISVYIATNIGGQAAYELRDYAGAEQAMLTAIAARKYFGGHTVGDRRDQAELSCWLAMAQARQGKLAVAAQTIAPVVAFERELAAGNHGDVWVPVELARALYTQALTDKTRSVALLREASSLLDAAPVTIRNLREMQKWRTKIAAEQTATRG